MRFAELAGGPTDGTAAFGIVMAVSFGAAAVGATLSTTARGVARGSVAGATAVLIVFAALALVGIALAPAVVLAGIPYAPDAAFYL